MSEKLNWLETGTDAAGRRSAEGGRVLAVADGTIGYTAELPVSMTAQDGLRDFAEGYDPDEKGITIRVTWSLWRNGKEVDGGEWTFLSE